ncbi:MAG: hypothetical protein R3264_03145 [Anaerolineae bacterium]|nr:hypothetical protein [Anaerolineae bacterium]
MNDVSIPWWLWIVAIDLFLLFMTVTFHYVPDYSWKWTVFNQFNLGLEMRLAAWWSSASLFLLSLLAYELFVNEIRKFRTAWIILAILFLLLSWDEFGSFHEVIGYFQGFQAYLAIGLVSGLFLSFALTHLYLNQQTRKSAALLTVAFLLFASVGFQEFLEHRINWSIWAVGLRAGIEEGTELLAILLGFVAVVNQGHLKQRAQTLSRIIPNPQNMRYISYMMTIGLVAHLVISFLLITFMDNLIGTPLEGRYDAKMWGNPAIWYPVVVSIFLSALAFWIYKQGTLDNKRYGWLLLSLLFLASSLILVYIMPIQRGVPLQRFGIFSNVYVFLAIEVLILMIWNVANFGALPNLMSLSIFVLAILLIVGFILDSRINRYIVVGLATFILVRLSLMPILNDQPFGRSRLPINKSNAI